MPGTALWVDGFICLPSLHSWMPGRCLPAWMPGTALWVDGFICLPSLHLSAVVSQPGCLARPFPSFVSAWMPGTAVWVDGFIGLALLPSAWMPGTALWVVCLSPIVSQPGLLLSPSLDGSLGGRVHLSPFVSLRLSPVVSQPGCLARLWPASGT